MAAGLNMDWRVGLVDGSGVALGTVGNPLISQIQAGAAAPASVELSDGAAFYVGAKTGQLPSALVNSRLDVNVGKAPGTVSVVNSSTATLLANALFTGTAEDVSGYAMIEVSVLADQVSAAGGLSLQFSSDGTHWDFAQAVTISASAGAAFAVCPCAQFFRIVYTNGGVNQGAFRLQTVYRPVAAVQSLATFQDVNSALSPTAISQRVAADLVIQNAAGNTSVRPRVASDNVAGVGGGSLLAAAGLVYDTGGSKFWPIQGTTGGQQFVQAQGIQASGAAVATNPVLTGGIDGANVRYFLTDTSGRQQVVGAAAAGAAVAGNPVLSGGSDGANAQALKVDTSGRPIVVGTAAVGAAAAGSPLQLGAADAGSNMAYLRCGSGIDAASNSQQQLTTAAFKYSFNGASEDRDRNNVDVTLLASAARTTTQSGTITTYNLGAIKFILDMTVVTASPSVTLTISETDLASGKTILLLSGAAVVTAVTNEYTVDPVVPAVANVSAQKRVPRTIFWQVTANSANSGTYSLGSMQLPA